LARQEREGKKVQKVLEKGGAVTDGEDYGPSQFEANKMMSNTLDHIVDHTPSYQDLKDLINIQVPHISQGLYPPPIHLPVQG